MLPSLNTGQSSLADVLPSCLHALGVDSFANELNLPTVRSAVVVLIDGLGTQNLSQASAHARFMNGLRGTNDSIQTVFPSTTAAALASLTTGTTPGQHGMLGYRIKDPLTGQLINLLTGISELEESERWLGSNPVYLNAAEVGIQPAVVAHPRFADTSLTRLIHRGAKQHSARTLDDRVATVQSIVCEPGSQLVVLYISELDECAHKSGVMSSEWALLLESVDSALKSMMSSLPDDVGVLITADHGVLDVPAHKQLLYGEDARLVEGISEIGGEPRCLQLYFHPDASESIRQQVFAAWAEDMEGLAWVMTKETVIEQKLVGPVTDQNTSRMGDIWVLARKDVVFYDARDQSLKGRSMIGQHGGMSATELTIPLLRAGSFL